MVAHWVGSFGRTWVRNLIGHWSGNFSSAWAEALVAHGNGTESRTKIDLISQVYPASIEY